MTASAGLNLNFSSFEPQPLWDQELLHQLQFLPGLKEILMLRQVHALEHGTVWVLNEWRSRQKPHAAVEDDGQFSGISTDRGFYLYGAVETATLHQAARVARRRLVQGNWHLAIHPRCGTNLSVSLLLTAGFALSFSLLFPKSPIEQIAGLGLAATAAAHLAPELGSVAQRHITTAIPFNLEIDGVTRLPGARTGPTHFVQVRWIE